MVFSLVLLVSEVFSAGFWLSSMGTFVEGCWFVPELLDGRLGFAIFKSKGLLFGLLFKCAVLSV